LKAMAEDGKPKARQYDQVAVNSIWREHCKKELSILKLNENFRLNPHKLAVLTRRTHASGGPAQSRGAPPPPRWPLPAFGTATRSNACINTPACTWRRIVSSAARGAYARNSQDLTRRRVWGRQT
jgi:hypothetical protein